MYIESFRIDGFGIFSGVQVDSLAWRSRIFSTSPGARRPGPKLAP